ncbi:STY0301 family protein [Duganella violaceipulchra]|uniref:Uncharacterized protein n=1 Tax=Duganella violaceipulchra TaxID=2849652 RepID=A0AA41HGT9_9BURK|nr:STY0301 family protein [Duganella violaceicalia]MBV6323931.1 hypothetical protein [Duganella violaceicalia]MCP2011088.1 hypothetical protein [Duganella violaceicalia]
MKRTVAIAFGMAFAFDGWAVERPVQQIECPAALPVSAIQSVAPPEGWKARPTAPFLLSSAGFNGGPPEMIADLVPYSVVEKRAQQMVETWKFDPDSFPDGLWLACGYGGAGGEITLSRQIDSTFSVCVVKSSPGKKAGSRQVVISCR